MPPSQLKRLKSSLRDQGITGPQKSKKQKKAAKGTKATSDRIQRNVALQQIRDSFNPFELKAPSRPAKFQHANSTNGVSRGGRYKDVLHRPGVTKSAGEEMRRQNLLPEMRRRNKVGGLVDRRIGEGDPGMTAEERAVERFAQEKQRRKGASLFDLEVSEDEVGLTHGGRSLGELYEGDDTVRESGSEDEDGGEFMRRKRRRDDDDEIPEDDQRAANATGSEEDEEPDRKRSRKEIMEEVIAKSKLHKYERQKAKEEDDDLREELDDDMNDIYALLKDQNKTAVTAPKKQTLPDADAHEPIMNPDRQKLLAGMDREQVDKDYDARLKQLARDTRAKPSDRAKTEEEKVREEAERLKELEERRMRRMRGEAVEDEDEHAGNEDGDLGGDDEIQDEAAEFGFTNSTAQPKNEEEKVVLEDEDEFALDEDLIASGSDVDMSDASGSESGSDVEDDAEPDQDEADDEFVKGFLNDPNNKPNGQILAPKESGLAFTYPCPRTPAELVDLLKDKPVEQLPTIIQRIRALHHPSLSAANKEAIADFSAVLVEHLSYMGLQKQPLAVSEQVIRHLHSLSRTYPETIANAFRAQLKSAHERLDLHAGDLVILTGIGSIYPTSDHFHQIVTPAITVMARWLGMTVPDSPTKQATGAFLVALCVRYQKLSKRYIPEAMRFTLRALAAKTVGEEQKKAFLEGLVAMADLWKDKSAFIEIFTPALPLLQKLGAIRELQTLQILLNNARSRRRPLELHHHRPLAIRMSVPKLEENFNPEKHYDPDKERSDARKLQKEFKRERKGALRELRKDANFIARQQLGEKKARDEEYAKKYRRLVAEIQGQEGHEGKVYEREKRARGKKGMR